MNSSTLVDKASGGFAEYVYPRWSTILGWFIFAFCILPIPLVFVISYIKQYRKIAAQKYSRTKPVYLAALTANTLPGDTWGPRRRIHQYGVYAHLQDKSSNNDMIFQQSDVSTTGTINPNFEQHWTINYNDDMNRFERF